ncbi:MAG: hypothetical protein H0W88_01670 [Parachlamydiaceae bacterium]|nr:hypothetical protein [Parachlamydiaceae bacterium]
MCDNNINSSFDRFRESIEHFKNQLSSVEHAMKKTKPNLKGNDPICPSCPTPICPSCPPPICPSCPPLFTHRDQHTDHGLLSLFDPKLQHSIKRKKGHHNDKHKRV